MQPERVAEELRSVFANDALRLADILSAIERIGRWQSTTTQPDRHKDADMYRSAVMRELAVIGEASNHLSDGFLSKHPSFPWRKIRGFRNNAIHENWDTQWAIVEEILEEDLPALKQVVAPEAECRQIDPSALLAEVSKRVLPVSEALRRGSGQSRTCGGADAGRPNALRPPRRSR